MQHLSFATLCYYPQHGRLVTARIGDFQDLAARVFRQCRVQSQHYVTECQQSRMYYVAKWDGQERWVCGFRDKAQAQKTLEHIQAQEILQNAQGHLYLDRDKAMQALQKELREFSAQHMHLRLA